MVFLKRRVIDRFLTSKVNKDQKGSLCLPTSTNPGQWQGRPASGCQGAPGGHH